MNRFVTFISQFPQGVSPKEIENNLDCSRTTLNRRLKALILEGVVVQKGKGPATKYCSSDAHVSLKNYFNTPHTQRPLAPYQEALLAPNPGLSIHALKQFENTPHYPLDKRELAKFLIDFSCASSALDGGTYSLIDTQVLIDYGEKAADKPLEDAILVLNHKQAFEYLYQNRNLEAVFSVHNLLTNDHELPELLNSRHFLTQEYRGKVREYNDIDIALSSYLPAFRPGTDYLDKMLNKIMTTAQNITHPIQAAFYLLTRIAYLQPFQDGNKRTSRVLCNVPLMQANLPPLSFVDFAKHDYIVALLAFYELGDVKLAESCFVNAYHQSIARLPLNKRGQY